MDEDFDRGLWIAEAGAPGTRITPSTLRSLCQLLERGVPALHAVKAVGVTPQDYAASMERGATALDFPDSPQAAACGWFAEIYRAVNAAIGRGVDRTLGHIESAMAVDWHAAKWLLEHQDPDAFAPAAQRLQQDIRMQSHHTNVSVHMSENRTDALFGVAEAVEAAHDPVAAGRWRQLRERAAALRTEETARTPQAVPVQDSDAQ